MPFSIELKIDKIMIMKNINETYMVEWLTRVGLLMHDNCKHHRLYNLVDAVLKPELILKRLVILLLSGIELFLIHIDTKNIITNKNLFNLFKIY